MILESESKVNLGLWVLGPRPDGYHEIISLFLKLKLGDTLAVKPSNRMEVRCRGCPGGEKNIVWNLLARLDEMAKLETPLSVTIYKRVPVGAGLGGGSGDAAALLRALAGREEPAYRLAEELGADVAFLLSPHRAAVGRGRGEKLARVELGGDWAVLVFVPEGLRISTRWAYAELSRAKLFTPPERAEEELREVLEALKAKEPFPWRNQFEALVFPRWPVLRKAKEMMLEAGALAAGLTGTGAGVVGLFPVDRGVQAGLRIERELGGTTFWTQPA